MDIKGRSYRCSSKLATSLNRTSIFFWQVKAAYLMCNLYSVTTSQEAVRRLFRVGHNRSAPFEPMPAIYPGWSAPVVRRATDGELELVMMSWGFVLLMIGRAPKRVTNARDDR